MPNHFSALKQVRRARRRTEINRRSKGVLRSALRQIRELLAKGNAEQARQYMVQAHSRIDKSVQKGILHKNAASRLKSRLMARLQALNPRTTA
ncbi:MAG: 30S ribosomal protein S20 [Acidobacteria bacterium]|nr:30S ribosomal protein S20 [Acidobacteriota bacterium]